MSEKPTRKEVLKTGKYSGHQSGKNPKKSRTQTICDGRINGHWVRSGENYMWPCYIDQENQGIIYIIDSKII